MSRSAVPKSCSCLRLEPAPCQPPRRPKILQGRLSGAIRPRVQNLRSHGIYFIAWQGYGNMASLQCFRFVTGKTKKIAEIEGPFLLYDFGVTVSPDGPTAGNPVMPRIDKSRRTNRPPRARATDQEIQKWVLQHSRLRAGNRLDRSRQTSVRPVRAQSPDNPCPRKNWPSSSTPFENLDC